MANNQITYVSAEDLNLPLEEIFRTMGYGTTVPEEEICVLTKELLKEARRVVKPRFYYTLRSCEVAPEQLILQDETLTSGKTISGLLRRSTQVAIFVATAGTEFQEWTDNIMAEGDMIATFVADSIGSVIAEATGDYMEQVVEQDPLMCGLKHTNRFSPGYCGWNIVEQHRLFGLLPEGVCGIKLSESSLMHPIKSISGVMGVGESVITKKYGCSVCKRLDCYLRRV